MQNLGDGMLCTASVTDATIVGGTFAIRAAENSRWSIADTEITGAVTGVSTGNSSAGTSHPEVNLERCTIAGNQYGLNTGTAVFATVQGLVRVSDSLITGNDLGIATSPDGQTLSRVSNGVLTNTVAGNTLDGSFTGTFDAK